MSQGWQKHFSFVQAKYSAGVIHLCSAYEAADYVLEALKTFDGSIWCVRYALVRGSGRSTLSPPPQEKIWNLGGASAGYLYLRQLCLLSDEYYNSETMSSGPPDLHKESEQLDN